MAISFSNKKWQNIKNDTRKWWAGELNRPLIQARLNGLEPLRNKPKQCFYSFIPFYDFSMSASEIIDVWDYELCRTEYLGDSFPHFWPNFGPGIIAAYMGAKLEKGDNTVWFHPPDYKKLKDIKFDFNPDNKWFLRTKDILQAAVEHWQGSVQIGLTDLGGNLDILSTFRSSEKLIYDLYDNPEDVKNLNWQAHKMWWKYFEEFNSITKNVNPGYSSWARIFSDEPHYILQCDFCYMLSLDMFEEFVKPELVKTAKTLTNTFYHLDGPGQLTHLDSLLEIDAIKGIQWVPGAGQPDASKWPDVYKKITSAGKKFHISSKMTDKPFEIIDIVSDQTGCADNIVYHIDCDISKRNKIEKLLSKYNV